MAGEDIYAGSSTAPLLSEANAFRPLARIPSQILGHERMARMMALKEAEFEDERARFARAEDRLLQDRLLKRRGGEAQGVGGGSGGRRSGGAGGAGADAELSALIGAQVDPALRGSELALSGALAAQSRADQEMAAAGIDAARNPEWIRGRSGQKFLEGLSGQPDAGRAHYLEFFGPPKPPKPTKPAAREAGEAGAFDPTLLVLGDKGLANPWAELGHGKEYVGNTGYAEELEAQGAAPEGFARRVEAYNSRLGLAEGREQARFATEYGQEAARIGEERRAARQERYIDGLAQTDWGKGKSRVQISSMADLLSRSDTHESAMGLLDNEAQIRMKQIGVSAAHRELSMEEKSRRDFEAAEFARGKTESEEILAEDLARIDAGVSGMFPVVPSPDQLEEFQARRERAQAEHEERLRQAELDARALASGPRMRQTVVGIEADKRAEEAKFLLGEFDRVAQIGDEDRQREAYRTIATEAVEGDTELSEGQRKAFIETAIRDPGMLSKYLLAQSKGDTFDLSALAAISSLAQQTTGNLTVRHYKATGNWHFVIDGVRDDTVYETEKEAREAGRKAVRERPE